MKIATVYFEKGSFPVIKEGNVLRAQGIAIPYEHATRYHPRVIFPYPLKRGVVPVVRFIPRGGGMVDVGPSFYDFLPLPSGEHEDVAFARVEDAPLWVRILLDDAKARIRPLVEAGENAGPLLEIWERSPDGYRATVDKRQEKGQIRKQNCFIAMNWDNWKKKELTMQERADALEEAKDACGISYGKLLPANLSKRAERLGLF